MAELILYAIPATWLAHVIGKPLVSINFELQKQEANFRFSMVRLRENAEAVALYRGEGEEGANFRARYQSVIATWWRKMVKTKQLGWFQEHGILTADRNGITLHKPDLLRQRIY